MLHTSRPHWKVRCRQLRPGCKGGSPRAAGEGSRRPAGTGNGGAARPMGAVTQLNLHLPRR